MRRILPILLLLAACSNDGAVSLGRMGGAAPRLILTSNLRAAGGSSIGTVTLTEELQGDRIVILADGVPEGLHPVTLQPDQCATTGAASEALPPLEASADGKAELYADIPLPRLRDAANSRLAAGFAIVVSIAGQRLACADFKY